MRERWHHARFDTKQEGADGNCRLQASFGLYAGSTTTPTEPSRHHRKASVATNTKRWISRR